MTRSEMIARLVFAMGGRAAEELVFREPTTGAVSDIEQATKIARAMVTEYGMSSKLGAVRYGTEHGDPFLGRTMGTQADYSHEVAADHRRRGAQAHRGRAHRGVGDPDRVPRRARHPRRRAAREGDAAPRRAAGHLRRREEAPAADHVRRLRWSDPVRQAADQDAGRAGDRARRAVAQAGTRSPRSRPRSPRPARLPPRPAERHERLERRNGVQRMSASATGHGATQPDYGAPAGWHAPGWPPPQQPDPPQRAAAGPVVSAAAPVRAGAPQQPYPPYQPYPQPGPQPPAGRRAGADPATRTRARTTGPTRRLTADDERRLR